MLHQFIKGRRHKAYIVASVTMLSIVHMQSATGFKRRYFLKVYEKTYKVKTTLNLIYIPGKKSLLSFHIGSHAVSSDQVQS